jgi:hypothetical protein
VNDPRIRLAERDDRSVGIVGDRLALDFQVARRQDVLRLLENLLEGAAGRKVVLLDLEVGPEDEAVRVARQVRPRDEEAGRHLRHFSAVCGGTGASGDPSIQ